MADIGDVISPRDVLDFWYGPRDDPAYGVPRKQWFTTDAEFDAAIAGRFGASVQQALDGGLKQWGASTEGAQALVLLLDQFTRNIYRGDAKAFGGDGQAREVARQALKAGVATALRPAEWVFLYLPFEHSEELEDQNFSILLFEALPEVPEKANWVDYAHRHREIIVRFGRFPHRNAVLGRTSTTEEIEFLRQPGSSF